MNPQLAIFKLTKFVECKFVFRGYQDATILLATLASEVLY
jgi:hypothetical protein